MGARRRGATGGKERLADDLAAAGWRFYALTTSDRPERRRHLERELGRLDLPFHLHVGERPTEADGFPSAGFRGCFESHLACLRAARADGAGVAVIAEDDVVLTRAFRRLARPLAAWLDQRDWAILHLGYLAKTSPARRDPLRLIGENVAESEGWEIWGLQLYAVRGAALDALIEDFEQRLLPGGHRISPDGVLNEFRRDAGLPTWLCLPNLAHQASAVSGTSPSGSFKERLLGVAAVPRAVGMVKRLAHDAAALVPPAAAVRRWNRRADRAATDH